MRRSPFEDHPGRRPGLFRINGTRDALLAQERRKANEGTVKRIVDNEADRLLEQIDVAVRTAEETKDFTYMGRWSGSEREDALRLALKRLEAAASA